MNDDFEQHGSKVFILSIEESEIVYFADRGAIESRVVTESRAPVSGRAVPGGDAEGRANLAD